MKIYYPFFLLLLSFYCCNNSILKQEICYDDIFEFTGMITHRYELIVYSMDKLNSCFIRNNPDVVINSEVYVNSNRDDKWIKFMESVSEINSYGTVEERISKMQWDLENNSDSTIGGMKWEYFYDNKDLIKEIQYDKEFNSPTSKKIGWNSVSKNEIKRDSLGRIISKIKYTSWDKNSWELERKSFFNYSNFTEIEENDDFHLDDKWKYIRERDNKGNLIKELTYIFKKDKWMLYSQREFIYTNKKEKESYKYWSWFFEKLEDKYSKLYIYDKEERLSRIITTSEHFFSNNESELYTDTLKLEYYNNGFLKKIDEGRDIFIFEYAKNGFIKKFLWQSVSYEKISNALMVNQSYTKN